MESNTPIFSSEFITNYGKWLRAIGVNSFKLFIYISINCLFILFFERVGDTKNIAFGDILENAPYYFISSNDFRTGKCPRDNKGKVCKRDRKIARSKAPHIYDIGLDHSSSYMIDRIMPRLFRIDKTTALPPYNYIAIPDKCENTYPGACDSSISKDTFLSYFITIITFIMWGYRGGFKMLSTWYSVLMYQSSSRSAIGYQIAMKLLLLFGWAVFLLIAIFTFFFSMMWGVYAALFEHYPSMIVYGWGGLPVFTFPFNMGNFVWRPLWRFILVICQLCVALAALMTGLFMWMPFFGPISISMMFWLAYPLLEFLKYNYYKVMPWGTVANITNYTSIVSKFGRIYTDNIQFIIFLMLIIIYTSSMETMDPNFTTGVGMVGGAVAVVLMFKGISQLFHYVFK